MGLSPLDRVSNQETKMRGVSLAIGLWVIVGARSFPALADTPTSPAPRPPAISVAATPPAAGPLGLVVVALAGATDAAWPLARAIYADESLRPASMDEPRARALCGEVTPPDASAEVRDLAETVASLRGDDAPSRAMLGDIALRFSVRAIGVVRVDAERPSARVFLPEARTFDAATYTPDEGPSLSWSATTRSLVRAFGDRSVAVSSRFAPHQGDVSSPDAAISPGAVHAPALATHDAPATPPPHRGFYESGWFWGALGAAAFAGGTLFLATRDSGASTIHLHMEVPR
jgi:hypothetical protein